LRQKEYYFSMLNMFKISTFILLLFILSPYTANTAQADIYSYTDDIGGIHFSNVPNDPRFKFILKTPQNEPLHTSFTLGSYAANQKRYTNLVDDAAKSNQLEPALLHAVISAESGYNSQAKSPKGAIGLMQLMPATAKRYGIANPYDPAQNIQAGAQYLRDLMHLFNNDMSLTLAAYNAGENNVIRHGNQIPPYPETIQYVPKVLKYYNGLRNN